MQDGGMDIWGMALLLWQALSWILIGSVLLFLRLRPRLSPLLRSWLLRATLVGVLVIPLGIWGPELGLKLEASAPAVVSAAAPESVLESATLAWPRWEDVAVWKPLVASVARPIPEPAPLASSTYDPLRLALTLLVVVWILGFGVGAIRWLRAYLACRRMPCQAKAVEPRVQAEGEAVAEAMDLDLPPLRRLEALSSPMLLGLREPVLYLPVDFPMTQAVWRHELTHLQRGDLGWQVFAAAFSHTLPLLGTGWLWSALRQADEEVADDAALAAPEGERTFADQLLQAAERQVEQPPWGISMAAAGSLEKRLRRLLDTQHLSVPRTSLGRLLSALLPVLLGVAGLTFVFADATTAWPRVAASVAPAQNKAGKEESQLPEEKKLPTLTQLRQMYDRVKLDPTVGGRKIKEIEVVPIGPSRMTASEVIKLSGLEVGGIYRPARLATATRRLYASGKLVNLRLQGESAGVDAKIVIIVQFNNQIRDFRYERLTPGEIKAIENITQIRLPLGKVVSALDLFREAQQLREEIGLPRLSARWEDIQEQAGMGTVVFSAMEEKR